MSCKVHHEARDANKVLELAQVQEPVLQGQQAVQEAVLQDLQAVQELLVGRPETLAANRGGFDLDGHDLPMPHRCRQSIAKLQHE